MTDRLIPAPDPSHATVRKLLEEHMRPRWDETGGTPVRLPSNRAFETGRGVGDRECVDADDAFKHWQAGAAIRLAGPPPTAAETDAAAETPPPVKLPWTLVQEADPPTSEEFLPPSEREALQYARRALDASPRHALQYATGPSVTLQSGELRFPWNDCLSPDEFVNRWKAGLRVRIVKPRRTALDHFLQS